MKFIQFILLSLVFTTKGFSQFQDSIRKYRYLNIDENRKYNVTIREAEDFKKKFNSKNKDSIFFLELSMTLVSDTLIEDLKLLKNLQSLVITGYVPSRNFFGLSKAAYAVALQKQKQLPFDYFPRLKELTVTSDYDCGLELAMIKCKELAFIVFGGFGTVIPKNIEKCKSIRVAYLDEYTFKQIHPEQLREMGHVKYWDLMQIGEDELKNIKQMRNIKGLRLRGTSIPKMNSITFDAGLSFSDSIEHLALENFQQITFTSSFFRKHSIQTFALYKVLDIYIEPESEFQPMIQNILITGSRSFQIPHIPINSDLEYFYCSANYNEVELFSPRTIVQETNELNKVTIPVYPKLVSYIVNDEISVNSPKDHRQIDFLISALNQQPNLKEYSINSMVVDVDLAKRLKSLRPDIRLYIYNLDLMNGKNRVSSSAIKPFLKELKINHPNSCIRNYSISKGDGTLIKFLEDEINEKFIEKLNFPCEVEKYEIRFSFVLSRGRSLN